MPKNERILKTEAVILRHTDWGEADRLLGLYSREAGKLRAIAKGIRRINSRKSGHLEPFTRVALVLAKGKDLWIVTQAESVDIYPQIREDLIKTAYAAYGIELLDRFTYEEGENLALYKVLVDMLDRLANNLATFIPIRFYEIRLLDILGFRPQLFNCLACRSEILPQDQFFSFTEGGVLCRKCGSDRSDVTPISMHALKYLRHFQRSSYAQAARAQISNSIQSEIEHIMETYFSNILERNLNTPSFIRDVRLKVYPSQK